MYGMNGQNEQGAQVSYEKRAPGWLGYIGDEKLPTYVRDYHVISHEKGPY